jgi:hypothetical protein
MLKSLYRNSRFTALAAALSLAPLLAACSGEDTAEAVDENTAAIELTPVDENYEFSEEELMFVVGSAIDIMFHEGGHMVIDLFDIPIMGQEEDAADNFGTLALLSMEDEFATSSLLEGIHGFYLLGEMDGDSIGAFFDEHDLSTQRASRKICHLISSDPETYGGIAKEMELDDAALSSCAVQFDGAIQNWNRMLNERNAFGESERLIAIVYGDAAEGLEPYKQVLEQNKMLEFIADYISASFAMPSDITISAESCGTPNAFYSRDEKHLVYCYELAQVLHDKYRASMAQESAVSEE